MSDQDPTNPTVRSPKISGEALESIIAEAAQWMDRRREIENMWFLFKLKETCFSWLCLRL